MDFPDFTQLTVTLSIVTWQSGAILGFFPDGHQVFPRAAWLSSSDFFVKFIFIMLAPTLPPKHSCKLSIMIVVYSIVYGVMCFCCEYGDKIMINSQLLWWHNHVVWCMV